MTSNLSFENFPDANKEFEDTTHWAAITAI